MIVYFVVFTNKTSLQHLPHYVKFLFTYKRCWHNSKQGSDPRLGRQKLSLQNLNLKDIETAKSRTLKTRNPKPGLTYLMSEYNVSLKS